MIAAKLSSVHVRPLSHDSPWPRAGRKKRPKSLATVFFADYRRGRRRFSLESKPQPSTTLPTGSPSGLWAVPSKDRPCRAISRAYPATWHKRDGGPPEGARQRGRAWLDARNARLRSSTSRRTAAGRPRRTSPAIAPRGDAGRPRLHRRPANHQAAHRSVNAPVSRHAGARARARIVVFGMSPAWAVS